MSSLFDVDLCLLFLSVTRLRLRARAFCNNRCVAPDDVTAPEDKPQQQDNMTNSAESSSNMEDFFQTVGEVRSLIENLSSQAEEVESRQATILSFSNQDKGNKNELELLNNETRKTANLVRAKLKSMRENWPPDENSANASVIHRIQRNQHSHLTRWFAEVMRGHHEAQMSFRETCKAKIQRQLEIMDKVTTDEELEEMLQRDNLTIFISDNNSDCRITSQAVTEIERRHRDIISLECGVKELHEIFQDTALLLETQGELINNIEKNVTSAAEYVVDSKEETNKAVSFKKNRYKIASLPRFLKPFKKDNSI
ncbi:syntaxin-2 isoform X1 [Nothobranchius furzeri]|uniref:Syntaxin 2a n=4 Tax=Nothobranchius TaxID=28779 RepID=A0A1A8U5D3_NOTFU|nr:syntaxin-2 isoform X1 [Nothobranchius furzeri]KAF7216908.1 transcript variant X1 [Nothobranchius furzeri]